MHFFNPAHPQFLDFPFLSFSSLSGLQADSFLLEGVSFLQRVCKAVYEFARAAVTNYSSVYFLTVLEAGSHSQSVSGLVPSEGRKGRVCSRPLSLVCRGPYSPCLHVVVPLYMFVCTFLLFRRTPVMLD